MRFFDFLTADLQASALAYRVCSDIKQLMQTKEIITVSIPGGKTPTLFFNCLSQQPLDCSRVRFILNDERWVPLDSLLSNEALLKKELQSNSTAEAEMVSLFDSNFPIEEAVTLFNEKISHLMPIDICIVGMGEDGHTASLFPAMKNLILALNKQESPALIIADIENKSERRVSLNLSALLRRNITIC